MARKKIIREGGTPVMVGHERIMIEVEKGTKQRVRDKALALGYRIGRGPLTGQGSISQLMEAIGRGDLAIVPRSDIDAVKKAKE